MSTVPNRTFSKLVWAGCILGLMGLGMLLAFNPLNGEPQQDLLRFVGRFHPVVLHLPIGLLALLFVLECRVVFRPESKGNEIIPMLLALSIGATLAAVGTGTLLAYGEGANEPLVREHMRNGIFIGMGTLLLGALRTLRSLVAYRVVLVATVMTLAVASHEGGSITHGSDYLTKYAPDGVRRLMGLEGADKVVVAKVEDLVVFEHLVRPIIEQNCQSCHNPDKLKGELNLETFEGHLAGGEVGPAVVPFDLAASEMIRRVTLPADDDDFMPSDEKPPLTAEEVSLLTWWIKAGASRDQKVGEILTIPDDVDGYITRVFAAMLSPEEIERIKAARVQLYADLGRIRLEHGILILPVEAESTHFNLETNAVRKTFDDRLLALLQPYAGHFLAADFSGTLLTDESVKLLSTFEDLKTLNLSRTKMTGRTLGQLAGLSDLESLNLYGTALTDEAIEELAKLTQLRKLFLFQTELENEEALAKLRQALPACEISAALGS